MGALPTTLFYDARGRLVDTHFGALSAASLVSKLQRCMPTFFNLRTTSMKKTEIDFLSDQVTL